MLGHEKVNTTFKYYIHSSDVELCGATANLHGRKDEQKGSRVDREAQFRVIAFPERQVS